MSWFDRVRNSLRYIRTRLVESLLIVAAIALGVSLVAAMAAFRGAYDRQTEQLLSHPAYREVVVEVVGSESELTEPVAEYDPEANREISIGTADLERARESVGSVQYAYLADRSRLEGGISDRLANAIAQGRLPGAGDAAGVGRPQDGGPASGGEDLAQRAPGNTRGGFDLQQLLDGSDGTITELPVEWVGTIRATGSFFEAYDLEAAQGSVFDATDVADGNSVMVLGSELAETLFPGQDPIGMRAVFGFQTYTILGVLAPSDLRDVETNLTADSVAYVPNAEAQFAFGGRQIRLARPTQTLRFAVTDSGDIELAASQLQEHFDLEYGTGTTRASARLDEVTAEREKLSRVLVVVLFLAAAALFIASINLFNLMLMRVIKRTKDVGINRALGASRAEVFRAFLNESAVMTIMGTALGLAVSPIVYRLLASTLIADLQQTQSVNWTYLIAGALVAAVVSLVFGVWPARQASRIDASLAIRTE